MEINKTITLVSNNYWTLYKFRFDVIKLFISKGYKVNLIAKRDAFHTKFSGEEIKKYILKSNTECRLIN